MSGYRAHFSDTSPQQPTVPYIEHEILATGCFIRNAMKTQKAGGQIASHLILPSYSWQCQGDASDSSEK